MVFKPMEYILYRQCKCTQGYKFFPLQDCTRNRKVFQFPLYISRKIGWEGMTAAQCIYIFLRLLQCHLYILQSCMQTQVFYPLFSSIAATKLQKQLSYFIEFQSFRCLSRISR